MQPVQLISVDQLVSPTPGYISQIKVILTIKQYKYATLYTYQLSRFTYTYLHKIPTKDETIEETISFERMCKQYSFQVEAYISDNGISR